MKNFEDEFQALSMLAGCDSKIEEFALLAKILGIGLSEKLASARTLGDVLECKVHGKRLKQLLVKQFAFVGGLKDRALVNEDSAWPSTPAVEA